MDLNRLLQTQDGRIDSILNRMYNRRVPAEWGFPLRQNPDSHLIYIKDGTGWYTLEGQRVDFQQGMMIFVSAGMPHSAGCIPQDPPAIMPIRFTLSGDPGNHKPFFQIWNTPGGDFWQHKFSELYVLTDHGIPSSSVQTGYALSCKLTALLWDIALYTLPATDPVSRVKMLIESKPAENHPLSWYCNKAGISIKYCGRQFRTRYGVSPINYRKKLRLRNAAFLLESTFLSLNAIAEDTGYSDIFTFSKAFKSEYAVSPGRFRTLNPKNQS